jgi:hypothetical protein
MGHIIFWHMLMILLRWEINRHRNTETLTDAHKEVSLEVNVERTKYLLLSHHQNSGQNHDIRIVNKSFENVAQFTYLGIIITNQNLIQEEI